MKRSHLARDVVEIVAITALIFVAIRFTIQSYHVNSATMQPGLTSDQFVMVNKIAYFFNAPERGDVIVFHYPRNTNSDYLERIIGVPGDIIQTDSLHVTVNGTLLKEPYVKTPYNPQGATWKVPAGEYFVLGDNRLQNDDSRTWDFVPKSYIVGKAVMVFWPFTQLHFINTYPEVFQHIKAK